MMWDLMTAKMPTSEISDKYGCKKEFVNAITRKYLKEYYTIIKGKRNATE